MNIVFKGKDGSVAIMTFAANVSEADEQDAIKKFHEAHPGKYNKTYFRDVQIPQDRTNRDSWTLDSKGNIITGEVK